MELTSSQFKTVTIILPLGLAQNYIVDRIKLVALLLILYITDRWYNKPQHDEYVKVIQMYLP